MDDCVGRVRAAALKDLPEPAKKELTVLKGKWSIVKFLHHDRETAPGKGENAVIVEFKGNTIDFGGAAAGVLIDFDPATDPKCFDFKVRKESGVFRRARLYESIYKSRRRHVDLVGPHRPRQEPARIVRASPPMRVEWSWCSSESRTDCPFIGAAGVLFGSRFRRLTPKTAPR